MEKPRPITREEVKNLIRDNMNVMSDHLLKKRDDAARLRLIYPEAAATAYDDLAEEPPGEFIADTLSFVYYYNFVAMAFMDTMDKSTTSLPEENAEDALAMAILVFEENNRQQLMMDAGRMYLMENGLMPNTRRNNNL